MQKTHLAKELSEILINISSHSGSRITNCKVLDPSCFVFDTQTGWNDAKVDLFYLSVVSEMDIIESESKSDENSGQENVNSENKSQKNEIISEQQLLENAVSEAMSVDFYEEQTPRVILSDGNTNELSPIGAEKDGFDL